MRREGEGKTVGGDKKTAALEDILTAVQGGRASLPPSRGGAWCNASVPEGNCSTKACLGHGAAPADVTRGKFCKP